jgi:hypothetical protein
MQAKTDDAQEEIKVAKRLDRMSFGAEFARGAILAIKGNQEAASRVIAGALQRAPAHSMVPLIEQVRIYTAKNMQSPDSSKPAPPEK